MLQFMKQLIFPVLIILALFACDSANSDTKTPAENINAEEPVNTKPAYYGEKITEDGAITGKELKDKMGNLASIEAKVKGEVVEVCQSEGCWMQMDVEDGTTMRVSMKDHSFFVPKDISGKMAV